MKKLLALSFMLALAGCAEKKPLTPEEQWQGYCRSVGNAARTIMLDRQNAIEKEKQSSMPTRLTMKPLKVLY